MTRRDSSTRSTPTLDRRTFLQTGAFTSLAAAGLPTGIRNPSSPSLGVQPQQGFALAEVTIADLQAGMATGRYTSQSLCELYLDRIRANDLQGPHLRAMLDLNPDAIRIAVELDTERRNGRVRGPLHGIPVVIKDNIDTADRMSTTAGSLALEGSMAGSDSFVAQRLRTAGAVILGKTNLSEWANFRGRQSSSGWSGRGGQCKNPFVLDRNPCGSSAGTGAAVSANFAAVGIGTETDGSVVCPSSANGLVGIKPTLGLISRTGIIPIAHSQDTAGPMARTVTDAAILLGALTGVDPTDQETRASQNQSHTDYTPFLDPNGLRGARIGVARQLLFGSSPETDAVAEDAIAALRDAGANIIDGIEIPNNGAYDDTENEVLLYEFKADLNAYLARLGPDAPVKTLADVIAFNEQHRDQELRYFGQETMIAAQEKGSLLEQEYLDALATNHRLSREEGLDAAFAKDKLDALIAPTGTPAWTTDLINGDHYIGGSSTPAAVSGYPSITVPMGFVLELPVGLSFIGPAYSEPTLLRLAFAFEQATNVRRAPRFLPTLGS